MSNKVKKTGTKRKLNVTWAALLWTDWGNICYTPVNSDRRRRTLHPQAEPGLHALATTLVLATTNPPSNKKKRVCAYGSVLFGLSCWRPGTGFVNVRFPPNFYHFIRSFIRSGQNHRARHSERGKKTRQTEEEVGGQHQGMDRPGVRQVPEGSGEEGRMEETGCEIICGAPTALAVKG